MLAAGMSRPSAEVDLRISKAMTFMAPAAEAPEILSNNSSKRRRPIASGRSRRSRARKVREPTTNTLTKMAQAISGKGASGGAGPALDPRRISSTSSSTRVMHATSR